MNIALSGGAVKGIAYCGVFKKMEEENIGIVGLAGTSIGSIFCLMRVLGYTAKEMEHLCMNLDIRRLISIDFEDPMKGLSSGKNIMSTVKKILQYKGAPADITMTGINEMTGKRLYIVATDIHTKEPIIFADDNTPVVDAIRYSISIPFLLESHDGYVDGCLSKNLPVDVFPIENTIGVYFKRINSDTNYFMNVFNCLQNKSNVYEIEYYKARGYNLIQIQTDIPALSFDIDDITKTELIAAGYSSMDIHLKK